MGSSLILKGGSSTPKTIEETISVTHSFAVGDVVRFDVDTGVWALAQANNATNSEVVGVIKEVQVGSFKIVYSGYIDLNSRYGSTTSPVMFLSADTAGGLSESPPSAIGTVVKPVLTRKSGSGTGEFIVMNYLGTQIGGSSTVSIEEIQPVGTIMPYASEGTVPETWLECNGVSYAVTAYPELYSALLNTTGDATPKYGSVVVLTGTGQPGAAVVGAYVLYKSDATSQWTNNGYAANETQAGVVGRVIAVGAGANTLTVQIQPKYNTTTQRFEYPNVQMGAGSGSSQSSTTGRYRLWDIVQSQIIDASAYTVTSVETTHFNTPDLRSRFPIGASAGTYPLANFGGTDITEFSSVASATPSGSGTNLLNSTTANPTATNIPPYLAVRYIIKAQPYTRAAIIDGVDIPYDQLLVGDLRSGLLRNAGVGEDLVFKTNTSVSTTGTERMRLTNGGNFGIGTTTPTAKFEVVGGVSASGSMSGARLSVSGGITAATDVVSTGGNLHLLSASSAGVATKTGSLHLAAGTGVDNGAITNDKIGLTVNTSKRVGIGGIYQPSSPLSVLSESAAGGIRVHRASASGVASPSSPTLALDVDGARAAFASWGDGYRFTTGATGSSSLGVVADRMAILGNGNVGIGTTTPESILQVNGATSGTVTTIINTDNSGRGLRVRAGNGSGSGVLFDVVNSAANKIHFQVTPSALRLNDATLAYPADNDTAPMFAARAWACVNAGVGPTLNGSGNIASVVRDGAGIYTLTFTTNMKDANYAVIASARRPTTDGASGNSVRNPTASGFQILFTTMNGDALDPVNFYVAVFR